MVVDDVTRTTLLNIDKRHTTLILLLRIYSDSP